MPAAPSYATGTRIATVQGAVAVEDLVVGDRAVTVAGEARPIRWIGHRLIDCRTYGRPEEVMPVRIARDAFGAGRPDRDLILSPAHRVCVDVLGELLVPIIALANGATVRQEAVASVTYWNVELDSHDILLAEGLPAESFLDIGDRGFFADGTAGLSDVGPGATLVAEPASRAHAEFCRPYRDVGPLITVLRERLRDRALSQGWRLQPDLWTDTHLVVDGARIDPIVEGLSARFTMPASARNVWLTSHATVPSHVSSSQDERVLGVCVEGLHVDDGTGPARSIDLADPLLCVGFHYVEAGPRRWTAGRARLPRALWMQCSIDWSLRLDLADSALPRWCSPRDAGGDTARGRPVERRTE